MTSASETIRIGISSCILGREVRFDGGHKLDRFIRDTLGAYVEFVPVCPEVEIGLGVPRETLRLVRGTSGQTLLIAPKSGTSHTTKMLKYSSKKVSELRNLELCGFIAQRGSPSCGMERVKLYPAKEGGAPNKDGRGLFTQVLMERLPLLPIEEIGRLNDPPLRENFIERVFAYRRLRQLFAGRWALRDLVSFQANEKLLLMAHGDYRTSGRLVAKAKGMPRKELREEYERLFLTVLTRRTTLRKHVNVLQHIAGYFRNVLDKESREEVHELIEQYRAKRVPLVVPLTLMKHHIRHHGIDYLAEQSYLNPHPRELMLRNHV